MFKHVYTHRVRYRECDPMSLVYHTHYVDYFEAARTEALRSVGLPYKVIEDAGIIMPVVDLSLKYKHSAYYDDLLEITTIVREMPTVRLNIEYEVRRAGDPKILATGHVTLCFVDRKRGRPIVAPEMVRTVFERLVIEDSHVPTLPE